MGLRDLDRLLDRHMCMGLDDDLRDVEEHVAEARRMVQRQKGLIIRVQAAGVST